MAGETSPASPAAGAPRPWLKVPALVASGAVVLGFLVLLGRRTQRTWPEYAALLALVVGLPLNWSGPHALATGRRRLWLGVGGVISCLVAFAFAGCELVLAFMGV